MDTKKFLNNHQPPMLQNATILLYINAVFALLNIGALFAGILGLLSVGLSLAGAGAGYGIANEKKWGWQLGIAAAIGPLAVYLLFLFTGGYSVFLVISILFKVALLVLLLHPISKGYVNTWFK